MYLFAVSGISGSGKTTAIEHLLRVYRSQGCSAATIKNSDCTDLFSAKAGSDTERQQAAGAACTVLRGENGTSFTFQRQLSLAEIVARLDQEIIILEGFGLWRLPKLLCAASVEQAEARFCDEAFACTGRLAQLTDHYRGLPVWDCRHKAEALAELALRHALREPQALQSIGKIIPDQPPKPAREGKR